MMRHLFCVQFTSILTNYSNSIACFTYGSKIFVYSNLTVCAFLFYRFQVWKILLSLEPE